MLSICTAHGISRRNYPPSRSMMSSDPVAGPFLHHGLAFFPARIALLSFDPRAYVHGLVTPGPYKSTPLRYLEQDRQTGTHRPISGIRLAGHVLHQAHHYPPTPPCLSLLVVQLVALACRRRQWSIPQRHGQGQGLIHEGAAPLNGGYRHPTQHQTGQLDDVPTTREQQ